MRESRSLYDNSRGRDGQHRWPPFTATGHRIASQLREHRDAKRKYVPMGSCKLRVVNNLGRTGNCRSDHGVVQARSSVGHSDSKREYWPAGMNGLRPFCAGARARGGRISSECRQR